MIDKEMFPKEYAAIERLKERSRMFEKKRDRSRQSKQELIEACRRRTNEQDNRI